MTIDSITMHNSWQWPWTDLQEQGGLIRRKGLWTSGRSLLDPAGEGNIQDLTISTANLKYVDSARTGISSVQCKLS